MIRGIFIDVDDTLLDFPKSSRQSAALALRDTGIDMEEEKLDSFMASFHAVNEGLWRRIEDGSMTRDELFGKRFPKVFEELGIHGDPMAMETNYRTHMRTSAVPVEGAKEILAYLSERYPVYVASNASRTQQEVRLSTAGMRGYIRAIYASSDLGTAKPQKAFFEACLSRVPFEADEMVMIGDSQKADIHGAAQAGMHTLWFNPGGEKNNPEFNAPDWSVRKLNEIRHIL